MEGDSSGRSLIIDVILALLAAWLTTSIYLSGYGADLPLNSDGVMPYVLFDDLFKHGSRAASWIYPVAPYWIPDQFLAWAIHAATSNVLHEVFLYGAIQYALFMLAARWVFTVVDDRAGRKMWFLWLLLWSALIVIGASRPTGWYARFHGYIFYPDIHAGTLLATVVALGILLRGARQRTVGSLVALSACSLALLISDQLFAIWFMLPAAIAMALPGSMRPAWRWRVVASLVGTFVLYKLLRGFIAGPYFGAPLDNFVAKNHLELVSGSAATMIENLRELVRTDVVFTLYELAALAALAAIAVTSFRRRISDDNADTTRTLVVFLAGSTLLPFFASLSLGRHSDPGTFRYCQTLGLAGFAIVLAARPLLLRMGRWGGIALPFGVLVVLFTASRNDGLWRWDLMQVHDAHAEQIACERKIIEEHGLKAGFAEYWLAMSVMARIPGVNILPLFTEKALPHTGLNMNLDWLSPTRRGDMGDAEFVDEGRLDTAVLDSMFGVPDVRLPCPESDIRIYRKKRGEPSLLSKFYDQYPRIIFRRFDHDGSTDVPAAAWSVKPGVPYGDDALISGDFPTPTEFLSAAMDATPGTVDMWIDYRSNEASTEAVIRYELVELNDYGMPLGQLAAGVLPLYAGPHHEPILSRRQIPMTTSGIGLRLTAFGHVNAAITAIGWSR
jgi:hypothetical protein